MAKPLVISGFVVAGLLLLLFGLDLAVKWPFDQASMVWDIMCVVCASILAYLSWNALRDLR